VTHPYPVIIRDRVVEVIPTVDATPVASQLCGSSAPVHVRVQSLSIDAVTWDLTSCSRSIVYGREQIGPLLYSVSLQRDHAGDGISYATRVLSRYNKEHTLIFDISGVLAPKGVHSIRQGVRSWLVSLISPRVDVIIWTSSSVPRPEKLDSRILFLNRDACYPVGPKHQTEKGRGTFLSPLSCFTVFDDSASKWVTARSAKVISFVEIQPQHVSFPFECSEVANMVNKVLLGSRP
jgi:hypothetical protein